ncbi:MAG: hypothetical protein ACLP9L_36760 [Thermoguttaceae bacterium]
MKKANLFVVFAMVITNFCAPHCFATSASVRDNLIAKWHLQGPPPDGNGSYTAGQMVAGIEKAWAGYYAEHLKTSTGGGWLWFLSSADNTSTAPLVTCDSATPGDLCFAFYNLSTQQPMPIGSDPIIGSVVYEVCTDYASSPLTWTPIGTSTDAASNFALPFTCGISDSMIEAVPYDTSGNPIVFTDPVDGVSNDAIGGLDSDRVPPVPEPASLIVWAGLGAMGLIVYARQRCRAKA